jgi:hypothetical protein
VAEIHQVTREAVESLLGIAEGVPGREGDAVGAQIRFYAAADAESVAALCRSWLEMRAAAAGVDVPEALQAAVDEVEALRLMSYTGGQPDLTVDDVGKIRKLVVDLASRLSAATGVPIPETGDIL